MGAPDTDPTDVSRSGGDVGHPPGPLVAGVGPERWVSPVHVYPFQKRY